MNSVHPALSVAPAVVAHKGDGVPEPNDSVVD